MDTFLLAQPIHKGKNMKNKNRLTAILSTLGGLLALWLGMNTKPVTPTPSPSPSPTVSASPIPSAFPTPSAAATPTATPSATPVSSTPFPQCSLPPSDGKCEDNPSSTPVFIAAVRSAQFKVADGGGFEDKNGKVVNEGAYTQEVARMLRLVGYCADSKLADEVWVKGSNEFSEHYDLVQRDGTVWLHYAARCSPAKF